MNKLSLRVKLPLPGSEVLCNCTSMLCLRWGMTLGDQLLFIIRAEQGGGML